MTDSPGRVPTRVAVCREADTAAAPVVGRKFGVRPAPRPPSNGSRSAGDSCRSTGTVTCETQRGHRTVTASACQGVAHA